ncbi:hypothetical protein NDU88_002772 [Pleurodeles waltl]|uniref:Uncharacterized protein n=1 Tax=Pleurodeles waltl TaxID=8319 RepID=A0AAV7W340_PLEWA|nr:hypothetical protein NDU88_002772 [Pleurodeles waltl]
MLGFEWGRDDTKERRKVEREDAEARREVERWDGEENEATDQGNNARNLEAEETKEMHPGDRGGSGEEQAEAERPGRCEGARCVPGGMWLDQVRDRLCVHLPPVFRRVGG